MGTSVSSDTAIHNHDKRRCGPVDAQHRLTPGPCTNLHGGRMEDRDKRKAEYESAFWRYLYWAAVFGVGFIAGAVSQGVTKP